MGTPRALVGERLVAYLEARIERIPEHSCWEWTGRIETDGYGRLMIQRRNRPAHRVVWEQVNGPVPDGLQLDHLCRNRGCVSPAHLEPVTCRTNLLRGETHAAANAAKTTCPQGHPFDEANTYRKQGRRHCRECRRQNDRQRQAERRVA